MAAKDKQVPPHFIPFSTFRKYALKLMRKGAKSCPCCGHSRIGFTTDETCTAYIIQCRACRIMAQDHLFKRVYESWNRRYATPCADDMATDVICAYFDENAEKDIIVTMDGTDMPEKSQPGSFRMKCLEDCLDPCDALLFKAGSVYEFKDGTCMREDGTMSQEYESFSDFIDKNPIWGRRCFTEIP